MNKTTDKCIPEKILTEYFNFIKLIGFPENKMSIIQIKKEIPSISNCPDSIIKIKLKPLESWKRDKEGNLMYDMSL